MNKEAKPVIIMSDTDYAKLVDTLMNNPVSESLGVIMDCIKVVADAKTEKRLWKIGYTENYNVISCNGLFEAPMEYKESDIRELTTSEAEEWFQNFHKEKPYAGLFKLYYKEDGEWVLYKEE